MFISCCYGNIIFGNPLLDTYTMKTFHQPIGQLFPNRRPLSYLNLTKNMKRYIRCKQHKNSTPRHKTIRTTTENILCRIFVQSSKHVSVSASCRIRYIDFELTSLLKMTVLFNTMYVLFYRGNVPDRSFTSRKSGPWSSV